MASAACNAELKTVDPTGRPVSVGFPSFLSVIFILGVGGRRRCVLIPNPFCRHHLPSLSHRSAMLIYSCSAFLNFLLLYFWEYKLVLCSLHREGERFPSPTHSPPPFQPSFWINPFNQITRVILSTHLERKPYFAHRAQSQRPALNITQIPTLFPCFDFPLYTQT